MIFNQRNDASTAENSLSATLRSYPLSDGALSRICGGNFLECRLELELADRGGGISHHGSSALLVHDDHVHEARGLSAVNLRRAALPPHGYRERS